jgi:hypothetical protein
MLQARQDIAYERRRQIQVRKALDAGLGKQQRAGRGPADFYLACVDYLDWSMDRLHRQDQAIHDLLRARIPANDSEAHEQLAALSERQDRSRALVARFHEAASALRAAGGQAVAAFEAEARAYMEAFGSLLQARRNPFFRHTDRLFTDADWDRIAGVTAQSRAEEQRLFEAVRSAAPPGADPAAFVAEHLAPG